MKRAVRQFLLATGAILSVSATFTAQGADAPASAPAATLPPSAATPPVPSTVPATSPATAPAVKLPPIRTKFEAGDPLDDLLTSMVLKYEVVVLKTRPVDATLL